MIGLNIIDTWICPSWKLDWCRQLNVENLPLVNEILTTKATADVFDRIKPEGTAAKQILATIIGLDLRSGSFRYADFTNTLLYGANFRHAELQGASFEAALLDYAIFRDAHLERASFNRGRARNASLKNASLHCAHLAKADLSDADLTDADLTDADLTEAVVKGANFEGVISTRVKLKGVDLTNAMHVPKEMREAAGHSATEPPSTTTNKHCEH
jgi:uncharacterized protein YjbI with pentapeptide repeats